MSFSQDIKNEMCRAPRQDTCCPLAECYGMLLLCNTFTPREIRLTTENRMLAEYMARSISEVFVVEAVPRLSHKGGKYVIILTDSASIHTIFQKLQYDVARQVALHLHFPVVEEDCCRRAFLRGMFLAGGFATDPEKKYHIELVVRHTSLSREIEALLLEMDLRPRRTVRQGCHILYFKESEQIEDYLTLSGAPASALRIMEQKVIRDVRNRLNRRVNAETANIDKTVDAAGVQLENIRLIMRRTGLASLPPPLREAAELRLEYPEDSLAALAEKAGSAVSKSGLNHRFKRIAQIALTHRNI